MSLRSWRSSLHPVKRAAGSVTMWDDVRRTRGIRCMPGMISALYQTAAGQNLPEPITLDQPVGTLPIVDDARWSASLTSDSVAALVVWVLLLVVLQLAMWPVVRRIFARFPDRGWAFGRLVSLLAAGYLVWLLASLEFIAFRAIWCAAAVALVAIASYGGSRWLGRPGPAGDAVGRAPRRLASSVLLSEGVFWIVFAVFLLFRLINHDSYHPIWGGEKPMEFAHINAILRSAHFPPYDPWYADGLLNYYYYGMYLVAFMMKLTGIPSEIAFNLAQPTLMALLAAGSFSVASALTAGMTRSPAVARIGGLVGVVLVTFSGNLLAMARMISSLTADVPPLSNYDYWFWQPTRFIPNTIHEFPYFTGTYADLHAHVVALPITVLAIGLCLALVQNSRGVLLSVFRPGAFPPETRVHAITIGLLALVLGSLFVTNAWDVPTYGAFAGVTMLLATRGISGLVPRVLVAAALTGGVAFVAYALVLPFSRNYVALYGDLGETRIVSPLLTIEGHLGVFFLIVAFGLTTLLSRLWVNPPAVCRPATFTLALGVTLLARWLVADRSPNWIEVFDNLTVLVAVGWLGTAVILAARTRLDFRLPGWLLPAYVLIMWISVAWALGADRQAFALFFGFGAVAGAIWLMARPANERFVATLIAAAMLVGAGVELVFLVDGLAGTDAYRMNTLFKFYNAVWIMLALASAALVGLMVRLASADGTATSWTVRLVQSGPASPLSGFAQAATGERDRSSSYRDADVASHISSARASFPRQWAQTGLYVTIVAIFASLMYPLAATGVRLDQQFDQPGRSWTLNALDWMGYGQIPTLNGAVLSYDQDREIIDWFNSEVPGSPVIAEANYSTYRCGGTRIAIHTGLPVVLGWGWHESQQRGWADIAQRDADLRTLYRSTNAEEKRAILERYRVDYLVVGDLERNYPEERDCETTDNAAGVAAFEPLVGNGLEVAFRSGDSVVYRIIG